MDKYRIRNPDGSLGAGLSISKMFADGNSFTPAKVYRLGETPSKPFSFSAEDRAKLNGVLSLADLNQHRSEYQHEFRPKETSSLSEADFEVIKKRTEEDFSTYTTDPEMNLRRNRYLMFTAEVFRLGLTK